MMRYAVLSLLSAFGLSACMQGATAIPVSSYAGPGTQFMSAYDAGVLFADTCLTRGPAFEDAIEGLRVQKMTRNAQTGTYYHNTANLSVKVTSESCSLVFASKRAVNETVSGLAKGTASIIAKPPKGISVTSQVAADGLRYFRLGIEAPVGGAS